MSGCLKSCGLALLSMIGVFGCKSTDTASDSNLETVKSLSADCKKITLTRLNAAERGRNYEGIIEKYIGQSGLASLYKIQGSKQYVNDASSMDVRGAVHYAVIVPDKKGCTVESMFLEPKTLSCENLVKKVVIAFDQRSARHSEDPEPIKTITVSTLDGPQRTHNVGQFKYQLIIDTMINSGSGSEDGPGPKYYHVKVQRDEKTCDIQAVILKK